MNKEDFKYPLKQEGVIDDFYKEIFIEEEYHKHGSKVKPGDVVVDCGAFIGMFSRFALEKGASKVYSFESEKSHYDCLVKNTKNTPKILPFHGYIDDKHIPLKKFYSIQGIIDDNYLEYIDFVKMDIEHHEYPVLINMENTTLNKVKKWAIEIHLDWKNDGKKYSHGSDFDGHKVSKLLYLMNKFSTNGFKLAYERPHDFYNLAMLYAWK
tara:strand:+ start:530 stop:1159 length:630 start_codon:yes stop_codon:yes gene_type:complete